MSTIQAAKTTDPMCVFMTQLACAAIAWCMIFFRHCLWSHYESCKTSCAVLWQPIILVAKINGRCMELRSLGVYALVFIPKKGYQFAPKGLLISIWCGVNVMYFLLSELEAALGCSPSNWAFLFQAQKCKLYSKYLAVRPCRCWTLQCY